MKFSEALTEYLILDKEGTRLLFPRMVNSTWYGSSEEFYGRKDRLLKIMDKMIPERVVYGPKPQVTMVSKCK